MKTQDGRPKTKDKKTNELTATLLYDGTCRFCTAQADRLRRLGRGRVQVESAYAPGVRERFPMLPPLDATGMMGEIKLVDGDGRVLGGAAAIARTLQIGGGPLGVLSNLYKVWPIRPIADAGYRFIARRRKTAQCTIEPTNPL